MMTIVRTSVAGIRTDETTTKKDVLSIKPTGKFHRIHSFFETPNRNLPLNKSRVSGESLTLAALYPVILGDKCPTATRTITDGPTVVAIVRTASVSDLASDK